jgi:O-antigen/teichoic acid export membrane protein
LAPLDQRNQFWTLADHHLQRDLRLPISGPGWLDAARHALTPRRLRQVIVTVTDQGLVSVATFLLNILLARKTTPTDYGVFVLAYSAINFMVDLQHSLLLEPMMVFGPAEPDGERRDYMGAVLALQLAFTGLLMCAVWIVCLGSWALGASGYTLAAIAMMPLGILGIQAREFTRRVFFASLEPGLALRNDVLYVSLLVSGLFFATHQAGLTAAIAFALLGFTGAVTAVIGLVTAGVKLAGVSVRIRTTARRHWSYGRWMIGVAGARWSANELYYFVAAGFLGTAGSAALKAVQNVFAPIGLFLSGLGNLFLPIASRLAMAPDRARLNHFAVGIGAVLGPVVLGYVVAVTLGSQFVFRLLYHGGYTAYAFLLPMLGAGQVLVAAFQGPSIGLRALQRPRAIFGITTISAAVTVIAVLPLTARWGLAGAVSSMLLSLVIASPMWVVQYRRAVRERAAS